MLAGSLSRIIKVNVSNTYAFFWISGNHNMVPYNPTIKIFISIFFTLMLPVLLLLFNFLLHGIKWGRDRGLRSGKLQRGVTDNLWKHLKNVFQLTYKKKLFTIILNTRIYVQYNSREQLGVLKTIGGSSHSFFWY